MRLWIVAPPALLAGCVAAPADTPAPDMSAPPPRLPVVVAGNPAIDGVVTPVDRPIGDDLAAVPTLGALTRAIAVAGMAPEVSGPGPVTLFAPNDGAWTRLQPGTPEALMKPENRPALVKLLRLHLVSGAITGAELSRRLAAGGGRTTLTSLSGEPIAVSLTSGVVTLTDLGGDRSYVAVADVRASNGVIHVVNGVLVPRLP